MPTKNCNFYTNENIPTKLIAYKKLHTKNARSEQIYTCLDLFLICSVLNIPKSSP